ncbi:hypothetical protein ANO14919_145620 [Xylariales sp. No.14919]|nr:hypothetical protein ANO14919_145620 [Xylariales sp. No.14919]
MTVSLTPEARKALQALPAEAPPPNVMPNFEHPWSMRESAEGALHSLLAISTILFILKMYAQVRITRKLSPEDYVLALAWLVYVGAFEPTGTLLARAPMGVHQWDITLGQFATHLFFQYCTLIIWGIIILLIKITILFQYIRVFVPGKTRNFTFWASHILIYLNAVYYIAFVFLQMFSCSPREKFWDKTIPEGHCLDIFAINVSGAVVCLASDIAILLLPQRVVFRLNLSRSKKMGLGFIFTIGIFACVTSAVRLYYNIMLWKNQTDITYQLAFMSFWGTAQIPTGFLITCLPTLPKVIKHIRNKPWCVRLEESIRTKLHISTGQSQKPAAVKIVTIGGGGAQKQKATVVSDIEFRELVAMKTNQTNSASSIAIQSD